MYSKSEILKSILICILFCTILDSYLNLNKLQKYCCCNIDKAYEYFKDITPPNQIQNIEDILVNNAFCRFGDNAKYISFQKIVRNVLKNYDNYTFPIKFSSFLNFNQYCKDIFKRENDLNKEFWETKCYSFTGEKL
jgi:hypothetical protein